MTALLERYFARLERGQPWRWRGQVLESVGQTIESAGPPASVGECCEIEDQAGGAHSAEVIGFRGSNVLSMPVETTEGIRFGDPVWALGMRPEIEVGPALMGRVLNAQGEPIDGGQRPAGVERTLPLDGAVRSPLDRVPIGEPLGTGIRAIDAMLTVGRGQRVGIFGGSGVGKSTLIGMMTRNTEAEVTVVGLVGERGREVGEFLAIRWARRDWRAQWWWFPPRMSRRCKRMRAALAATTVAEYFAGAGQACAAGARFADALCHGGARDRSGCGRAADGKGIHALGFCAAGAAGGAGRAAFAPDRSPRFIRVLMEGDDQQDPLVDAVRSLLDGHVVLSRALAAEGWYPPIEVLDSISRLMPSVTEPEHREQAALVRKLMAVYARSEDLVRIGAYKPGADADLDRALRARDAMRAFLTQDAREQVRFADWAAPSGRAGRGGMSDGGLAGVRRLLHVRRWKKSK